MKRKSKHPWSLCLRFPCYPCVSVRRIVQRNHFFRNSHHDLFYKIAVLRYRNVGVISFRSSWPQVFGRVVIQKDPRKACTGKFKFNKVEYSWSISCNHPLNNQRRSNINKISMQYLWRRVDVLWTFKQCVSSGAYYRSRSSYSVSFFLAKQYNSLHSSRHNWNVGHLAWILPLNIFLEFIEGRSFSSSSEVAALRLLLS